MNKQKLYDKIKAMVPVKSDEKKDYREIVRETLNGYFFDVKQLDVAERPENWDKIKVRLKQLCDGINRAIESEYKGMRHSAYTSIKNQLDGYRTQKTDIEGLALNENIYTVKKGTLSYRMRNVELEEQHKLKPKDMFHIPLDKRGLVETQRYSVPGYPCLYLAHRVYGCWEEMGRPAFGTVMVSKFEAQQDFRLLDLRVPSKENWENDMVRCMLIIPLVIASMVQVKNSKDKYKPEYLIPQLLTEWVISKNRESKNGEEVLGIMYTSAQKNDDFSYPDDSYDNYAIPVLKPLSSKKYCSGLKQYFMLTAPTYYDLEVLRQGERIDGGSYDEDTETLKLENIRISHFGMMEEYLNNKELKQIEE